MVCAVGCERCSGGGSICGMNDYVLCSINIELEISTRAEIRASSTNKRPALVLQTLIEKMHHDIFLLSLTSKTKTAYIDVVQIKYFSKDPPLSNK